MLSVIFDSVRAFVFLSILLNDEDFQGAHKRVGDVDLWVAYTFELGIMDINDNEANAQEINLNTHLLSDL